MKNRYLSVVLFALSMSYSVFTKSQNLVSNPSFEETGNCLSKRVVDSIAVNIPSLRMAQVTDWTAPSRSGTPDMFQACFDSTNGVKPHFGGTTAKYGTPLNSNGWQTPHSGNNYAGIILLSDIFKDYNYREYLSGKLLSPLKRGQLYTVTFWCNLSDNSDLASNSIGIYLSKKAVEYPEDFHGVVEAVPQVANPEDRFLTNKKNWVKVSAQYQALGGEQFLLIGNFNRYDKKDYRLLHKPSPFAFSIFASAYYFIDDVCVSAAGADCYALEQDTLDMPDGVEVLPYAPHLIQVRGKVFTYKMMDKKPVEAEVRFWSKEQEQGVVTTGKDGQFRHTLDTAKSSFALIQHPDFFPATAHISKKLVAQIRIPLYPIKKNREVRLLHYTVADDGVKHIPYSTEELRLWASFLQKNPTMKVEVKSYGLSREDKTKDSSLSEEANKERLDRLAMEKSQALSKRIAQELIALGVSERQLIYKGCGNKEAFPLFKSTIEWVGDLPAEEVAIKPIWDIATLDENMPIVLENIYFEPNSATLLPPSIPLLEELAEFLLTYPLVEMAVHGHTDNGFGKTSPEYLKELSEQRSLAVKEFLVAKGVSASRIQAIGFGMSQPIATNDTEEGKRKNRRTAFVLLKK